MTLVNLKKLLPQSHAIAGLVCLGWEEVRAFVEAAQIEQTGVALMVGPGARANMPIPIWGRMLCETASQANVPIAVHLDHGRSYDEALMALDCGFTSVMFDGSSLTLADNINQTRTIADLAKKYDASSEGEIGFVGYANGADSLGTDPVEAKRFATETEVDFMAVSVGNSHLQTAAIIEPNWHLLAELAKIKTALVIHGGSGFSYASQMRMACEFNVRKFNIGTRLRQVFGSSLRHHLNAKPRMFDHIEIMSGVHQPLVDAASLILKRFKK